MDPQKDNLRQGVQKAFQESLDRLRDVAAENAKEKAGDSSPPADGKAPPPERTPDRRDAAPTDPAVDPRWEDAVEDIERYFSSRDGDA